MSRREFLKTAFEAGAAILFSQLITSREARAQLEKLLPHREFIQESFEDGIERLHNEVFNNKNERFYVYIKKGAVSGWLNIEEAADSAGATSISLLPIFIDEKIEEMHFVHTHSFFSTAEEQNLPERVRDGAKAKGKSLYPEPPSEEDIRTVAILLAQKENRGKWGNSVVDSAGVWTYSLDTNNALMKIMAEQIKLIIQNQNDPARKERIRNVESIILNLNRELVMKKRGLYGAPSEREMLGRLQAYKKWMKDAWGVNLTFRPHEERKW